MNTALALIEDDNKADNHRRARRTASSRPKPHLYLVAAHGRLLRNAEEDETITPGNRAGRITRVVSHTTSTSQGNLRDS